MPDTQIKNIHAREILDSRGNPTVEATVVLRGGARAKAAVPSGASTGIHEAHELRDGGKRYGGKGVRKAVKNVNTKIFKALKGKDAAKQREIDEIMIALDGTQNKKKLGANAILAVSLACARAAATARKKPLYKYIRSTYRLKEKGWNMPLPTMNVINGGRHADNGLSVQEFMIVPRNRKFADRVRVGSEVFHALHEILIEDNNATGVGDEGGFAPQLEKSEDALKLLMKAVKRAGYTPGRHVAFAMDPAASEFYEDGTYTFDGNALTPNQMQQVYGRWLKKYPIISLEDPFDQGDWDTWVAFCATYGKKVSIVGDDLFVTNTRWIQRGIELGAANAVLIKVNQIGTLSEAIDAIKLAKSNGYKISVSHRSGETADTFIADLAVAVNADFLKSGSLSRSERVEKYNRVMEIEREIM